MLQCNNSIGLGRLINQTLKNSSKQERVVNRQAAGKKKRGKTKKCIGTTKMDQRHTLNGYNSCDGPKLVIAKTQCPPKFKLTLLQLEYMI